MWLWTFDFPKSVVKDLTGVCMLNLVTDQFFSSQPDWSLELVSMCTWRNHSEKKKKKVNLKNGFSRPWAAMIILINRKATKGRTGEPYYPQQNNIRTKNNERDQERANLPYIHSSYIGGPVSVGTLSTLAYPIYRAPYFLLRIWWSSTWIELQSSSVSLNSKWSFHWSSFVDDTHLISLYESLSTLREPEKEWLKKRCSSLMAHTSPSFESVTAIWPEQIKKFYSFLGWWERYLSIFSFMVVSSVYNLRYLSMSSFMVILSVYNLRYFSMSNLVCFICQ